MSIDPFAWLPVVVQALVVGWVVWLFIGDFVKEHKKTTLVVICCALPLLVIVLVSGSFPSMSPRQIARVLCIVLSAEDSRCYGN